MNEVILGFANEIFVAIATPIVIYLAALARSYVKAKIAALDSVMDAEARARIEAAFENAIAYAEKKGTGVSLDEVVGYVRRFNAGDLARFGLTGEGLQKRAAAAIARAGL